MIPILQLVNSLLSQNDLDLTKQGFDPAAQTLFLGPEGAQQNFEASVKTTNLGSTNGATNGTGKGFFERALPFLLPAAGGALSLLFSDDEYKKIAEGVLLDQIDFGKTLKRREAGNLTSLQTRNLLANAEPRINQIASNVSSRGLGQSGAGVQVIAQAQADVFRQDQDRAAALLPGVLAATGQTAGQLADIEAQQNRAFISSIGTFVKLYTLLQGNQNQGGQTQGNQAPPPSFISPELNDTIDIIHTEIKGGFRIMRPSEGPPF